MIPAFYIVHTVLAVLLLLSFLLLFAFLLFLSNMLLLAVLLLQAFLLLMAFLLLLASLLIGGVPFLAGHSVHKMDLILRSMECIRRCNSLWPLNLS